jgi:hypothetical protein
VEQVIVCVWESRDDICAERLTPSLLALAQHLARFEDLSLTAEVEEQLEGISRATVGRLLRKHRSRSGRLPQKGAERANQVTKGVPMGRIPWDTKEPGHFEVDLVHHGGESSTGEYGHTIQLVDVATGWSLPGGGAGPSTTGDGSGIRAHPGSRAVCTRRGAS